MDLIVVAHCSHGENIKLDDARIKQLNDIIVREKMAYEFRDKMTLEFIL